MGILISFPQDMRLPRMGGTTPSEPATIIILPVVRIERHSDASDAVCSEPATPRPRRGSRRLSRS